MNKQEILKQYKNEDKLLVAKILDKLECCNKHNKILNTNFINEREEKVVINVLNKVGASNYIIYGGYREAQRNIVIFYPKYFNEQILKKAYNSIIQVININLPEELYNTYIIVHEDGADIIILKEISEYIVQNITLLTRFSKSKVTIKEIEQIKVVEQQREELQIIIPSLRIDNIVSELTKSSRNKANELIMQERVLLNYETVTKNSKLIKEKDIITIRGNGKFEILEQIGETKKKNIILKISKYK